MFGYRMNMAYKAWIAHTLYLSSIHPLTHNNNSIIDNSIVITSQYHSSTIAFRRCPSEMHSTFDTIVYRNTIGMCVSKHLAKSSRSLALSLCLKKKSAERHGKKYWSKTMQQIRKFSIPKKMNNMFGMKTGEWVKCQQNYYRNLLSNRRQARQMCTVCRSFYILCKTSWKPQWFEIRCRWYRSFAKALNYSTTYIFHV